MMLFLLKMYSFPLLPRDETQVSNLCITKMEGMEEQFTFQRNAGLDMMYQLELGDVCGCRPSRAWSQACAEKKAGKWRAY